MDTGLKVLPSVWSAFVHFVVVTLNVLSITPIVLFVLMGGFNNEAVSFLPMVSGLSWLVLVILTLILVITSNEHRRIALYGMLVAFGLSLLFAFPSGSG